jgi:hypothetical protein
LSQLPFLSFATAKKNNKKTGGKERDERQKERKELKWRGVNVRDGD